MGQTPSAAQLPRTRQPPRSPPPSLIDALAPCVRWLLPPRDPAHAHATPAPPSPLVCDRRPLFSSRMTYHRFCHTPSYCYSGQPPLCSRLFPNGRRARARSRFSYRARYFLAAHLVLFSTVLKPLAVSSSPQLTPHSVSHKLRAPCSLNCRERERRSQRR